MGLWVGKKFTFLGLDYYWGTQIGGQKGKGPKMPKTPAQAVVLVIGLLISVALSCWLVDALFNPDSGLNEAERLEKALRQVDRPAGYRLDALTVQEAEGGKYDVEMTFYHRRTGKGDLTDDRDLTAAVKSLRGMDRDVRDKLGRVKLALRYAYAGYYVDVTELDMNPFDGSLPEATRWTERVEN